MSTQPVTIIGINGSLRPGSITQRMVEAVLDQARSQGAQTSLIDLKRQTLPFCDGRSGGQYGPVVDALETQVRQADALVIGTPEYHGGYSGVLKNFLDLLPTDAFRGKVVALVGAAGGRLGTDGALNQLRVVFKNLDCLVLPTQASVSSSDLDAQDNIVNPRILDRLAKMGNDLVGLARKITGKTA